VFPCHLLHDDPFFLGNILQEDLDHILSNPILSEIRIESPEISECATCTYLSLCGGGCKASVYRKYNRFDRPDPECRAIRRSFDMRFTRNHMSK
jgi:radical SAM protein with 4Fe4S-binding SPASM domain